MNNLEDLKQELITQKTAIEDKGGVVAVSNINPSPSEITSGINSIVIPEVELANAGVGDVRSGKTFFSGSRTVKTGTLNVIDTTLATATEADVTSGKTFFAGNDTLKTGTSQTVTGALADATVDDVVLGKTFYAGDATLKTGTLDHDRMIRSLTFYANSTITQPTRITISMPSDVSVLCNYFAWNNYNPVDFYFHPNVSIIPTYAFYGTRNFTFPNFTSLTRLTTIDTYSFYYSNKSAFDMQSWPPDLRIIEARAFQETITAGSDIILPNKLERLGMYCFCSTANRVPINSISIPHYTYYSLPQGLFYFVKANCDFTPPSCVTTISTQFNYRGSFKNVTIPSTCTRIESYAFGSMTSDAVSNYHMESFTFLSETPPTIGTEFLASQYLSNSSFRIYVPDTAVSTYKAVTNLRAFTNVIVGESERP